MERKTSLYRHLTKLTYLWYGCPSRWFATLSLSFSWIGASLGSALEFLCLWWIQGLDLSDAYYFPKCLADYWFLENSWCLWYFSFHFPVCWLKFAATAFKFPEFSSELDITIQDPWFSIYHTLHQFQPIFAMRYLVDFSTGICLLNYELRMALAKALSSFTYGISSAWNSWCVGSTV